MKKAFPWILVGAIVAVLVGLLAESNKKLKDIEQTYIQEKQISEMTIKLLNDDVAKKEDKIAELNGALDSSNTVIVGLEDRLAGKDADLAELRKKWGTLSLECQGRLQELDSAWTAKFSLSQEEIGELKKQVRLADERDLYRQGQILDLKNIIVEKNKIIVGCEKAQKDVAKLYLAKKRASRLKTVAMVGLGALGFALGRL